jgi:hypothetical protein
VLNPVPRDAKKTGKSSFTPPSGVAVTKEVNRYVADVSVRLSATPGSPATRSSCSGTGGAEIVGTPGGWGAILDGPGNFPGHPNNAGWCYDGAWENPRGKLTSGSLDKPHPHCVGETGGSQEEVIVRVVLEPISARYETFGTDGQRLALGKHTSNCDEEDPDGLCAFLTGNEKHSRGVGIVVGYAIDLATLGTTNRRVGMLTFNLNQYHNNNVNHFDTDCVIGEEETAPRCLKPTITATYAPLDEGGVGTVTEDVTGFLYWSPATVPFNYGD